MFATKCVPHNQLIKNIKYDAYWLPVYCEVGYEKYPVSIYTENNIAEIYNQEPPNNGPCSLKITHC